MSSVFIVGAGYVGLRAAEFLAAKGARVRVGRRSLPEGVAGHAMDVLRPETFPEALRSADAVVYCVAADSSTENAYRAAYVTGLRNVLAHLAGGAARRFVFVSSTGVYGQSDGSVVDERTDPAPTGFTGKILLEGEALLGSAPFSATTIRFSGIYGPGRHRIVDEVRAGSPVSRARWEAYTNRIHRDDCARALVHLVGREQVAPLYVGSDERPAPLSEVMTWIASRLGVAPPPVVAEAPGERRMRGGSKRCSSALLRSEGFALEFPSFREGYALA